MTTRKIRIAIACVLGGWAMVALWFVPAAIAWVHGGGGPAAFGRWMRGRADVPLEAYLGRWSELAVRVTFVAVTSAIVAWFVLPLVSWRRESSAVPPDERRADVPLALPMVLWVAGWGGLVLGLGESYYLAWKMFVLHEVVPGFRYGSADSLWMAPVTDAVVVATIGVLAWGIGRAVRRPLTIRWLFVLIGFVGLWSLIMVTGRLATPAAALLSLGVASRLGSPASRQQSWFVPIIRRAVPRLAAAVVAVGLCVTVVSRVTERRAVGKLPASPADAPNVLVVTLDTERASSMSLYGYDRPTTPNLARIARQGVLFDRAMAPSSWTLPSHASMFTSRYPGQLSATWLHPLDDTYPTLAEVLRARGYMTAGFVANLIFGTPFNGLNRGFVHYEAQPVSLQMALESSWLTRAAFRRANPDVDRSAVRKDASRITQDFLGWQAAQSNTRPYLAFLNYFDAHAPYVSPPEYPASFSPDPAPALRGDNSALYSASEIKSYVNAYDRDIAYVDAQLGVLFAELEKRGQLERTLVVVTADHGEEFGEHGKLGHGFGLTLPVLHVPLLVVHPSLPAGLRVSQAVTLTDLPATVMEFVGVRDHPFRGQSWSRFWNGGAPPENEPVFSQYDFRRSVLAGDWHYLVGRRQRLFNVAEDPAEQLDRFETADPELLEQLRSALEQFTTRGSADGQ